MKRSSLGTAAAVFFLATLVALAAGCGRDGPSGKPADIEGFVSSTWGISADPGPGGVRGSILIDGEDAAGTGRGKASVDVTEETLIWDMTGSKARKAGFEELEVGQRVQAIFTGPVAESYPLQATASEIIIVRRTEAGEVLERHAGEIMAIRGVTGFGISGHGDEPAIVAYIERDDPSITSLIPSELEGFKVLTEVTGPIEALPQ